MGRGSGGSSHGGGGHTGDITEVLYPEADVSVQFLHLLLC